MAKPASFFKKIAMFFATAAFAALLVPGLAFADVATYGSSSAPDNTIGVTWTDANGAHTATVNLDSLSATTETKGALFNKGGVWNVVGAGKYVTLGQVLNAATYVDDDGDIQRASSVWASGKSLSFTVWNGSDSAGWACENYTKYSAFSYANILAATNFYGGTTASALGAVATDTYTDMIIALTGNSVALSGTTTATSALGSMTMSAANAPRVMWGYLDASNVGGNRFPSNIDSITIS